MIAVDTIEQLLKPVIEDMGLLLWGCEYSAGKRTALLRVYIDKIDGDVGLDDCAGVSRQIGALLDVEAGIDSHYHLEVSSPGLSRPLFKEAHYAMSLGKEIKLTLYDPVHERRNFSGRLVAAEGDQITLCISDSVESSSEGNTHEAHEAKDQNMTFALRDIKKAKLIYSFTSGSKKSK